MQNYGGYPLYRPPVVIVNDRKSVTVALLLAFFFGPLGMFYSTVVGALVMMLVNLVVGILTLGLGLFLTWPAGLVWAAIAVSEYNDRQMQVATFR
ncbi:hypothetical protein [Austwickia sp. TVS 96-490-7B]|uniref:hypothetical protein n=1 Tax=Austwickia sp. TVS 96-490-7B TaxID=2830843 RepID=UPI001C58AF05|nr:hypothetical protein [Austwickia sp. TVS 96-490-7B]